VALDITARPLIVDVAAELAALSDHRDACRRYAVCTLNRDDPNVRPIQHAGDCHSLARELIEFRACARKRISALFHNQSILRSVLDAGARAPGIVTAHHVLDTANGIAEHSSQSDLLFPGIRLLACKNRGGAGQHEQVHRFTPIPCPSNQFSALAFSETHSHLRP
jgi:hypothetical protein